MAVPFPACWCVGEQPVEQPSAASGITEPGGKISAAPASQQRGEILRRDDAADDDHDVGAAEPGELGLELGDQRQVAGGQRHAPTTSTSSVDGLGGGLGGGLEQGADLHVEAQVGEGRWR